MLAIGTILNEAIEAKTNNYRNTIVFGSGHGYGDVPKSLKNWKVYFVRGPHTAKSLSLNQKLAITDPGVLVAKFYSQRGPNPNGPVGYMPHFRWGRPEIWSRICKNSNVLLVDPRDPIETVIKNILSVKVLLTEAMHGAIISDCLRVPWIPIVSHERILISKWQDWADSLDLKYEPINLKSLWTYLPEKKDFKYRMLKYVLKGMAVRELEKIAIRIKPTLSSDKILDLRLRQIDEKISELCTVQI